MSSPISFRSPMNLIFFSSVPGPPSRTLLRAPFPVQCSVPPWLCAPLALCPLRSVLPSSLRARFIALHSSVPPFMKSWEWGRGRTIVPSSPAFFFLSFTLPTSPSSVQLLSDESGEAAVRRLIAAVPSWIDAPCGRWPPESSYSFCVTYQWSSQSITRAAVGGVAALSLLGRRLCCVSIEFTINTKGEGAAGLICIPPPPLTKRHVPSVNKVGIRFPQPSGGGAHIRR